MLIYKSTVAQLVMQCMHLKSKVGERGGTSTSTLDVAKNKTANFLYPENAYRIQQQVIKKRCFRLAWRLEEDEIGLRLAFSGDKQTTTPRNVSPAGLGTNGNAHAKNHTLETEIEIRSPGFSLTQRKHRQTILFRIYWTKGNAWAAGLFKDNASPPN